MILIQYDYYYFIGRWPKILKSIMIPHHHHQFQLLVDKYNMYILNEGSIVVILIFNNDNGISDEKNDM